MWLTLDEAKAKFNIIHWKIYELVASKIVKSKMKKEPGLKKYEVYSSEDLENHFLNEKLEEKIQNKKHITEEIDETPVTKLPLSPELDKPELDRRLKYETVIEKKLKNTASMGDTISLSEIKNDFKKLNSTLYIILKKRIENRYVEGKITQKLKQEEIKELQEDIEMWHAELKELVNA